MLRRNEPSDNKINEWLLPLSKQSGFPVRRINPHQWQLDIKSSEAAFTLYIHDQDDWISYAVPIIHDVEGKERVNFYRVLLDLNAKLNGVHIGLQGNLIILSREEPKEKLDRFSFTQSIFIIISAHKAVYPMILSEIKKFGLRAQVEKE